MNLLERLPRARRGQGANSVVMVLTHPCPESYTAAVAERIMNTLIAQGVHPKVIDLYDYEYDPHLPFPADHLDIVAEAEMLVIVHPTWWGSQPAILTGWLASVSQTGLPATRQIVCVTTLGGPRLGNRLAGEAGIGVIRRALRAKCVSRPAYLRFALYGNDGASDQMRRDFLDRLEHKFQRLVR
jgi:NAD(P)H dehydrogenase (quinone)